jgi:hypothetical protein
MENLHELGNQIERLTRETEVQPTLTTVVTLSDGSERIYSADAIANGSRNIGKELTPPRPAKLLVSTLTGFVDAVKAGVAGDGLTNRIVHVEDFLTVSVKSTKCDEYGIRDTLLTAKHIPLDAFVYGEFYADPAKFIIALQTAFYNMEENAGKANPSNLMWLIAVVSHLRSGDQCEIKDDGKAQTVTIKQGEVGSADVTIPPRIKLTPRSTFDEAAPVEREFLLRFKQTPAGSPSVALFAVDGTKWQGECMRSIAHYLKGHLPTDAVILA